MNEGPTSLRPLVHQLAVSEVRVGGSGDPFGAGASDHALTMETRVLALTVVDRESMLWALDEPPTDALAELRGVLLSEHEWRVREELL